MIHNAIQMREAIDKLIDRVKSPRFNDDNYYDAINQAIAMILDDRIENIKQRKPYSVQSSQRLRDELNTLVVPPALYVNSGNTIPFPADYRYLLSISPVIDGVDTICRPISYNEARLMRRNPFKRPNDYKCFYNENSSGFLIEYEAGRTLTGANLDYIKIPNKVSIGKESDKINAGAGVLTPTSVYIVYSEAIHNGVTYYEGDVFTAANANLTSGTVILRSLTTDTDMPERLHEEIIRGAGAIMNGTVEDWQKQLSLKNDNKES